MQGCVQFLGSGGNCDRDSWDDWGEYGEYIRELFIKGNWGQGDEAWERQSFEDWARVHVRTVGAESIAKGADAIRAELAKITDYRPGVDIHLLGHSEGGRAVARYILDAAAGKGADARVKSALLRSVN